MLFFNKKNKEEIKENLFSITINLKENKKFGYEQRQPLNSGLNCILCFYNFYKWFYYRDSPSYSFFHKEGVDIILRSEITSITMRKTIEIQENTNS